MADDGLKVKIGGDATEHNAAMDSAQQKGRSFAEVWKQIAAEAKKSGTDVTTQAESIAKGTTQAATTTGKAVNTMASSTRTFASSMAMAVSGSGDLSSAASNVAFSMGQMGQEMQKMGAATGGATGKVIGLLGAWGPWAAVGVAAAGAASFVGKQIHALIFPEDIQKIKDIKDALDDLNKEGYQPLITTLKTLDEEYDKLDDATPEWASEKKAMDVRAKQRRKDIEDRKKYAESAKQLRRESRMAAADALGDQDDLLKSLSEADLTNVISAYRNELIRVRDIGGVASKEENNSIKEQIGFLKKAEAALSDLTKQRDEHMDKVKESSRAIAEALGERENKLSRLSIVDLKKAVAGYRAELKQTRDEGGIVDPETIKDLKSAESALADLTRAQEEARERNEERKRMAAQSRAASRAEIGISAGGSALADEILGPPGVFETRIETARALIATLADATRDTGMAIIEANIGAAIEHSLGPSVRVIKASAEESANALGLVGEKRAEYIKQQKHAEKAEKAMQLSMGETLKAATRDALKAIATKAAIEGAFKIASAIFPPNPALAASGAALLGVAAAAGAAAAAIGPVRKKALPPLPSSNEERADTRGNVGAGAREGASGAQTFNNYFYMLPGTDERRIGREVENTMNRSRRSEGKRQLGTERDDQQDQI